VTPEQEPAGDGAETALDSAESPIDSAEIPSADGGHPSRMNVIKSLTGWCRAKWRPILLAALVIAAMGLAAMLFFFQYRPDRQIDDAAAHQAVRAASDGAAASLTYSADTLDRDIAKAKSYLTGEFLSYYNEFTQQFVAPMAQEKHITQKAVMVRAAVSDLHPDSAVVLVYLNQTTTSKDKPQPLITPSSVRVTLTKVGGSWLISKLDPMG
jgi:Mce-associated membrane protein